MADSTSVPEPKKCKRAALKGSAKDGGSKRPVGGAAHRSQIEKEEAFALVAKMDRRGHNVADIARACGISHRQAWEDLYKIKQRYAETVIGERKAMVAEKLEQLKDVMCEAWAAWERSKADRTKRVEKTLFSNPNGSDETVTVEGRDGNPAFLHTVLECIQAERELLALDPPKEARIQVQTVRWDLLAQAVPDEVPDEVEAEIAKLMNLRAGERLEATVSVERDPANEVVPDAAPQPSRTAEMRSFEP